MAAIELDERRPRDCATYGTNFFDRNDPVLRPRDHERGNMDRSEHAGAVGTSRHRALSVRDAGGRASPYAPADRVGDVRLTARRWAEESLDHRFDDGLDRLLALHTVGNGEAIIAPRRVIGGRAGAESTSARIRDGASRSRAKAR